MTIRRIIGKLRLNTPDICFSSNKQNAKVMSIQITYDRGVYEVNGLLNSQNGEALKEHLEGLMIYSKGFVLSLNKVVDIDINAANMIWELYRRSCVSDTLFYIIGIKNQKVKELFNRLNYDDILL